MSLTSQMVRVGTGADEEGCLIFCEDRLVAVLVHLSPENDVAPGQWFYEAGFGALDEPEHPTFSSLDEAKQYIRQRIEGAQRQRPRSWDRFSSTGS